MALFYDGAIDRLAHSLSLHSHSMTVKDKGKEKEKEKEEQRPFKISNYQPTTKAIDVFGKEVEPICNL